MGLNGRREKHVGGVISGFGGQMSGFWGTVFTVFGRGHGTARGLGGGLDLKYWIIWYGRVDGAGKG